MARNNVGKMMILILIGTILVNISYSRPECKNGNEQGCLKKREVIDDALNATIPATVAPPGPVPEGSSPKSRTTAKGAGYSIKLSFGAIPLYMGAAMLLKFVT
ncbi:uncharacterized protein LOC135931393 isoform X2 [Gordionus sp. m RMFG-2023]|uniref:uncharacterized protein LOC135931393 isoform X2 n=1 Tax=Gordionus sp. m RMFG-2023 TaxID=3053472 RepID=UPI0031FBEF8B